MMSIQMLRSLIEVTAENDAEVTLTLNAVVDEFKIATRRKWISGSYSTIIRPGLEQPILFVDGYPLSSVTVSEREALSDSWTVLVNDSDYSWTASGMIENIRDQEWAKYVKIDYSGGYAIDAAPSNVLLGIALEVRRNLARNESGRIVLDSQLISDNGTTKYLDIGQRHPAFVRAIERHKFRAMN